MTTEHQEALDKTVGDLFAYLDNIWIVKGIYKGFSPKYILNISPPYLNFRDALFHYRKMYNAANRKDSDILLEQKTCITEHLNRGIRDFIVHLCSNCYIPVIYQMMQSKNRSVDDIVFRCLRQTYHTLKNIVAEIRLSGMAPSHYGNIGNWLQKMIAVIGDFHKLLGKNKNLKSIFTQTVKDIGRYQNKPRRKR